MSKSLNRKNVLTAANKSIALWLLFDINSRNDSAGKPFSSTYVILKDSWSTWAMSGVESIINEKYFPFLIFNIISYLTALDNIKIICSTVVDDKYDVFPFSQLPNCSIWVANKLSNFDINSSNIENIVSNLMMSKFFNVSS